MLGPRCVGSPPTRRIVLLRTHKLKGDLGAYWAFSVDDDLRVLFRWEGEEAFLVNLGSHDEVY